MIYTRKFGGWRRDLPDGRDIPMRFARHELAALPPVVDLAPAMPPVNDQMDTSACTGYSSAKAVAVAAANSKVPRALDPSPMFIYYNARLLEGCEDQDAGSTIRSIMKGIAQYGVCSQKMHLADPSNPSNVLLKPSPAAYQEAASERGKVYRRLDQTLQDLKAAIASGYGFTMGIMLYSSAMSPAVDNTGIIPMPNIRTERQVGGHALYWMGYNDETQRFKLEGSWSEGWGEMGFGYIPYDYLLDPDLASDPWVVTDLG